MPHTHDNVACSSTDDARRSCARALALATGCPITCRRLGFRSGCCKYVEQRKAAIYWDLALDFTLVRWTASKLLKTDRFLFSKKFKLDLFIFSNIHRRYCCLGLITDQFPTLVTCLGLWKSEKSSSFYFEQNQAANWMLTLPVQVQGWMMIAEFIESSSHFAVQAMNLGQLLTANPSKVLWKVSLTCLTCCWQVAGLRCQNILYGRDEHLNVQWKCDEWFAKDTASIWNCNTIQRVDFVVEKRIVKMQLVDLLVTHGFQLCWHAGKLY
jgi:hypothetical protein